MPKAKVVMYGIPNCTSVRKAKGWLEEHGVVYTFVDLKKTPLTQEEVSAFMERVGPKAMLNRKGTKARILGIAKQELKDSQIIKWMTEEQLLIKRPLMSKGKKAWVGYDPAIFEKAFLRARRR